VQLLGEPTTQPVIWEWSLIHGWPGRLISSRWGRKLPNDWVCLALSFTGEAVCPSGTEFCLISSSYGPWWTMRAPFGGPLPAATSESCRFFNPSVFALLLVHLGTSVTCKFTR
jgi:hypothetical protein